jgi:hypothetical protein
MKNISNAPCGVKGSTYFYIQHTVDVRHTHTSFLNLFITGLMLQVNEVYCFRVGY